MGQPARRAITEHASDRPVRITRQPPEGLENRQVGFARAELLDALAASDAHGAPRERADERVDERGLADPGFAAHEPDSSCPLLRGRVPLAQLRAFFIAPDQRSALGCSEWCQAPLGQGAWSRVIGRLRSVAR